MVVAELKEKVESLTPSCRCYEHRGCGGGSGRRVVCKGEAASAEDARAQMESHVKMQVFMPLLQLLPMSPQQAGRRMCQPSFESDRFARPRRLTWTADLSVLTCRVQILRAKIQAIQERRDGAQVCQDS